MDNTEKRGRTVETQRQNKQEIGREIDLGHLLRNYWKAAKRFWWVLLITTVLFAGLLPLVMSLIKTPEYEATCSFTVRVVSNSVTSEMGEQFSIYYDKDLAEQLDKTFTYILTSDHLGDEVKQQLGQVKGRAYAHAQRQSGQDAARGLQPIAPWQTCGTASRYSDGKPRLHVCRRPSGQL